MLPRRCRGPAQHGHGVSYNRKHGPVGFLAEHSAHRGALGNTAEYGTTRFHLNQRDTAAPAISYLGDGEDTFLAVFLPSFSFLFSLFSSFATLSVYWYKPQRRTTVPSSKTAEQQSRKHFTTVPEAIRNADGWNIPKTNKCMVQ